MANATRRLNINLPAQAAADLEKLAESSGRSMTEVIRNALGLVRLAQEAHSKNQKLIIADQNDKPLKEIVLG
jgi:Arc/MetJ-type ribon-helix-helix transcriptional regulator